MEDENPTVLESEEPKENTADTQEQNVESEGVAENDGSSVHQEDEAATEVVKENENIPDTQEQNVESEGVVENDGSSVHQEDEVATEVVKENENIPDTQEQNVKSEGVVENDGSSVLQEDEVVTQVVKGNGSGEITSQKEPEHSQPLSNEGDVPSFKISNVSSVKEESHDQSFSQEFQKSHQSVGQHDLRCNKLHPAKPVGQVNSPNSTSLISKKTGQKLYDNFNQTSLIWERKPLAEILHPSGKTPQRREVVTRDKDKLSVGNAELDVPSLQRFFDNVQPAKSQDESQVSDPGEKVIGSQHSDSPPMDKEEHDTEESAKQPSQEQQPNEAKMAEDAVLVSKKTGKELKTTCNQTSLIWEKKPLAEILGSSGSEKTANEQRSNSLPDPFDF